MPWNNWVLIVASNQLFAKTKKPFPLILFAAIAFMQLRSHDISDFIVCCDTAQRINASVGFILLKNNRMNSAASHVNELRVIRVTTDDFCIAMLIVDSISIRLQLFPVNTCLCLHLLCMDIHHRLLLRLCKFVLVPNGTLL